MFNLNLPSPDTSLLFRWQWNWLPPGVQIAFLVLVCLVPISLILWLYRYELKLVTPGTAAGLLSLRLIVLVLLLFLLCLQPTYAHTPSRELRGRVLIAVDRSDSMSVADPQRSVEEKLRLARALKLTSEISDVQLEAWAKDVAKGSEPRWLNDDESANDLARRRTLEAERRAAFKKVLDDVDRLTRNEVARRVLDESSVALLKTLREHHDVELIGFDREGWKVNPDRLEELFPQTEKGKEDKLENKDKKDTDKEKKDKPSRPRTAGQYTDLSVPLRKALEWTGDGGGRVLGVIVLTDGQHNFGDSPTDVAKSLGERDPQLPVYPIALGAKRPPAAVAVVLVKGPPTVFKDDLAPVEVRFKIVNMPAQDFTIELRRDDDDKTLLAQQPYTHDGRDVERTEEFKVRMEKVGTEKIVATIKPVKEPPRSVRMERHQGMTAVNVADDKAKVLLIDGEAGWEYHYLSSVLKRDRKMQMTAVVFEQPRLDKDASAEKLKEMGSPLQKLPEGPDALAGFDCIILGDVSETQLPLKDRVRLEKYVADRGGTLVILAGKRAMPLGYPDAGAEGETDPLRKLLPIESAHEEAQKLGFQVTLTAQGRETKFLQLDADQAKNDEVWGWLPKHYWAVIGKAKPGASTLAFVPEADQGANKLSPEREKERALIVRQNYGFGRVLYVGLDSTWRRRYMRGDDRPHTFWAQAIRWAASDKPLATGNEFVRFGTPQPIYHPDEPIQIVARLSEEAGPIDPAMKAGARLIRLDGDKEEKVALLELGRREAQPRVLEGQMNNLAPGRYAIEMVLPGMEDKLRSGQGDVPLRSEFTIEGSASREMLDLETRWPLLLELAANSGGKVYTPEDAHELAKQLVQKAEGVTDRYEQPLYSWWPVLAVVLLLLTLEWAGRKLSGLP